MSEAAAHDHYCWTPDLREVLEGGSSCGVSADATRRRIKILRAVTGERLCGGQDLPRQAKGGYQMGDLGDVKREIYIEPIMNPVPQEAPAEAPKVPIAVPPEQVPA